MDKSISRNAKRKNRRKKKKDHCSISNELQLNKEQKPVASDTKHGTVKDIKIYEGMYPVSIIEHIAHIFPKDLCIMIDDYLLSKDARNHIKLKSTGKPILGAIEEINCQKSNPSGYNAYLDDQVWSLHIFTIDCNIKGEQMIICQIYSGFDYSQNDLDEIKRQNLELNIHNVEIIKGKRELSNHNDIVGIMYGMYYRSIQMCSKQTWYDVYDEQYLTELCYNFTWCNYENEFNKWYKYTPPKIKKLINIL
jgi:hypothetical protein